MVGHALVWLGSLAAVIVGFTMAVKGIYTRKPMSIKKEMLWIALAFAGAYSMSIAL